jgi:NADH:ubiquinone oxidoreductase subunit E
MINEDVYGNLNEERVKEIIKEYREKEKKFHG